MSVTATTTTTKTTSAFWSPISPLTSKMKEHFLSLDIPLPTMPLHINGHRDGLFRNRADSLPFAMRKPVVVPDPEPAITTWLLDTRTMWPGDNILAADGAAHALSLISLAEQNIVTGKMFIADAKMSLASALLKRFFISKTLDIPWKDVRLARKGNQKHGKPCAVDDQGRPIAGIDFNVSHQNGLVTLIGYDGRKRQRHSSDILSPNGPKDEVIVGADIVCVNERETAASTIDEEGFDGWVDIYEYVFSDEERWSMKYDMDYMTLLDGSVLTAHDLGRHDRCIARDQHITLTTPAGRDVSFSSECLIDSKLRRFYTYFCYKEAYIKLAGEALLAPWLKQLEFFNVRSPKPGTVARCSTHGTWGEEVDDVEVRMHGRTVDDVKMKIQAFEEDFMLSVAIQGDVEGLKIPAFTRLHLEKDVLAHANEYLTSTAPEVKSPVDLLSPWESRYW